MMDFSGFLRAHLVARSISQRELAAQLGVSHVSLNKWLNGRIHPRLSTVAKIVAVLEEKTSGRSEVAIDFLDCPPGDTTRIASIDGKATSIIQAFDGLSGPGQRFIAKMVEELKRAGEGPADPFVKYVPAPVADFPNHLLADMPGVLFRALAGQDGNVKCVYVSPRSRDIVGRDPADLLAVPDLPYRAIVADEDRAWVIRAMEEFLVTGKTGNEWQASFRISTTGSTPLWVDTRTRMTIRDNSRQQVDGLIVKAAADVTDGKIGELRSRDPRTNLCTRSYFVRLLAVALDAISDKESVAVIVIQIENFQNISSAYGIVWQDALQRVLAKRLSGLVRRTDIVGHITDGVFGVIIAGPAESPTLQQIAAKLVAGLTGNHQLSGQYVPILVHGMITIARRRGYDAIDLLRRTLDMANSMMSARSGGVAVYEMDAEHGAPFDAASGGA